MGHGVLLLARDRTPCFIYFGAVKVNDLTPLSTSSATASQVLTLTNRHLRYWLTRSKLPRVRRLVTWLIFSLELVFYYFALLFLLASSPISDEDDAKLAFLVIGLTSLLPAVAITLLRVRVFHLLLRRRSRDPSPGD